MLDRQNVALTLPWMWQGTDLVAAVVADLSDAQIAGPSALPGWARACWRTWRATPKRSADWSTGPPPARSRRCIRTWPPAGRHPRRAHQSADALRADFADTAGALDAGFGSLDEQAWQAVVRSALGRELPAAELPWMRIREVWLHAIDLAAGVGFDVIPADLLDVLLDDSTAVVGGKPDCPTVLLSPSDRDRTWTLGTGDTPMASGRPPGCSPGRSAGRTGLPGQTCPRTAWL